ncbi:SDR family oxidoreductase [Desulfosediminicola ganghwensis]|uniref:SDR family oxidoreductase n=1 Tax=Desulfosediminicola ganghwensis TaxID=2569540 RepID=UPI0010ACD109|nr:SDR family NAD(P)-dependent oxidoreductase [Desulfosediminicola ganghwensis]
MQDFSDQNVIVTGATRGIGKAITEAFLVRGGNVFGIYGGNTQAADAFARECEQLKGTLELFQCDISSPEQVDGFYSQIESRISSLDVLINNAGIRRDAVMAMMKTEDWSKVIDINLNGTYLMSKPAVLLMMRNKFGRIINITSPVSHLGFAGQTNYAASKAGQIGLTRSLAKETAKKKITVNCVSPGFIATDFIDDLPTEQLAEYKKMVPMKRFGTPEEVADAVLFLASKKASYITGSVLEINGGL